MDEERVIDDHMVVVIDGVIASVEPDRASEVPIGATVIDGLGGFLMPGLHDTHGHPAAVDDLILFVAKGVTTVWILNADEDMLEWKSKPQTLRPTLRLFAGPISGFDDPTSIESHVNALADAGFDGIKPYGNLSVEAFGAAVETARTRGLLVSAHIPRNLTWQEVLPLRPDVIAHAEEFLYSPRFIGPGCRIKRSFFAPRNLSRSMQNFCAYSRTDGK